MQSTKSQPVMMIMVQTAHRNKCSEMRVPAMIVGQAILRLPIVKSPLNGLRSPSATMVTSRSRNLNRQAFNRRNMSIDERRAYDDYLKQQKAATTRNVILSAIAVAIGALVLSHPQQLSTLQQVVP